MNTLFVGKARVVGRVAGKAGVVGKAGVFDKAGFFDKARFFDKVRGVMALARGAIGVLCLFAAVLACAINAAQAAPKKVKVASIDPADTGVSVSAARPLKTYRTRKRDDLVRRLENLGLSIGNPVLIRIFKQESQLELWMKRRERFVLFATYDICKWSGGLGPKLREGDSQSPEGFYTVADRQIKKRSRHLRALNLGFPNLFDRSLGRTGSYIMIHGGCSSVGCFAITNPSVAELYDLTRAAVDAGQKRFQVQVFPFRMTDENLARHKLNPWYEFWTNLRIGHDLFAASGVPPVVTTCGRKYYYHTGKTGSDGSRELSARCVGPMAAAPGVTAAAASTVSTAGTDTGAAEEKFPDVRARILAARRLFGRGGVFRRVRRFRVRCGRRRASCRRWIALRTSARYKRATIARRKRAAAIANWRRYQASKAARYRLVRAIMLKRRRGALRRKKRR